MRLFVGSSSIGGPLELVVPRGETVDGLRTRLSRQLNMHTDRIVLLHKDKQLTAGKLLEQGVADGSRLTLQVPAAVEAGLSVSLKKKKTHTHTQRKHVSTLFLVALGFIIIWVNHFPLQRSSARAERIVDVLERLADCEISDFLSGRSPLAIKLGMGAHTMHVQLQLSPQDVAKLQLEKAPEAISSPPTKVNMGQSASSCSPTRTFTTSAASSPPTANSAGSMQFEPQAVPSTTPVCYNDSIAASQSPLPASTFKECFHSSTVERIKQPGAVIESFVKHSQGVFSGTFSGTLAPCSQSGVSRRARSIVIILKILDDLLRAASNHQGAPSSLCPALDPPAQEHKHKQNTNPASEAPAEEAQQFLTNSEENQTLHCKLKHLQSLMVRRRHHRRTRKGSQFSRPAHPYQRHHRF
ncbi:midnolin-like isoform X2 [Phycodurus eques]|uniref:midnolin-like isoform X2 n=1 Tax=Phycodurus eques TaxID=693459 RepID=UPI002ACEE23D|nr:midnolin-like isoform X2 [Phycodurus eques]